MDRGEFPTQLAKRFPEVISRMSDHARGLLHCDVADFRRVVESAMDGGQLWRVERYLRFLEDCRAAAGPALANAVDVSFLEDFALGECTEARRRAVRERMPARLRQAVISVSDRWR
jgi:hypothetical protein